MKRSPEIREFPRRRVIGGKERAKIRARDAVQRYSFRFAFQIIPATLPLHPDNLHLSVFPMHSAGALGYSASLH